MEAEFSALQSGFFRKVYQFNCSISSLCFYNPVIKEDVPKKEIDAGYELIGVSLTIDSTGSWINFLLWPQHQPIV